MLSIDVFLLVLRLLFIVLLYLFLMQVVIAITRDLKRPKTDPVQAAALGHLVVMNGGSSTIARGTSFVLEARTTIGRGPTNTISIKDDNISSEHALLEYRNGSWYVKDVGSRNGTFVNNQPAYTNNPLPAKIDDLVRVGDVFFQLKP